MDGLWGEFGVAFAMLATVRDTGREERHRKRRKEQNKGDTGEGRKDSNKESKERERMRRKGRGKERKLHEPLVSDPKPALRVLP